MEQKYEFKDLPLSPVIAEKLIRELFGGKTAIKTAEIEKTVVETHKDKGGKDPNQQKVIFKALGNLKEDSFAFNRSRGFWDIVSQGDDGMAGEAPALEEEISFEKNEKSTYPIYGRGAGGLYVYYYPTYKELADLKNEKNYPCKIGRSDIDPVKRATMQASTAMPERPKIAFKIHSDDPALLERTIHGVLTLKQRLKEDAVGTEWFLTNPDEVLEEFKKINPDVLLEDISTDGKSL